MTNITDHFIILFFISKISKAGKKIKHIIKLVLTKWITHIMFCKPEISFFVFLCTSYTGSSEIQSCYIKSFCSQQFCMTTRAATQDKQEHSWRQATHNKTGSE